MRHFEIPAVQGKTRKEICLEMARMLKEKEFKDEVYGQKL